MIVSQAACRIAVGMLSRLKVVFLALSIVLQTISGVIEGKSITWGAIIGELRGISSVIATLISKLQSKILYFPEIFVVRLIKGFYKSEKGGL